MRVMFGQQRIFQGSYQYHQNGAMYSEENFQVYRVNEDSSHKFHSEILTRCPNGEFLRIDVKYHVNEEWYPIRVIVNKSLGVKSAMEDYRPVPNTQTLRYSFESEEDYEEEEFSASTGLYHIATPACASSIIYLASKTYDPTKSNSYSIIRSSNDWEYTPNNIKQNYVYLETEGKKHGDKDIIELGEAKREGRKYLYYESPESENVKSKTEQRKAVEFFVSEHMTLPYKVTFDPETYILISNLRNLDNTEVQKMVKGL